MIALVPVRHCTVEHALSIVVLIMCHTVLDQKHDDTTQRDQHPKSHPLQHTEGVVGEKRVDNELIDNNQESDYQWWYDESDKRLELAVFDVLMVADGLAPLGVVCKQRVGVARLKIWEQVREPRGTSL